MVEFLAGGTLTDRLQKEPLPARQAVSIALQLADALEALHETGCLHGDVRPSNVGFTSQGLPKLLDFGLARGTNDAASAGGTLRHLSPEVLSGRRPAGEADDVWSLCVVLHETALGEHPFAGGNVDETAERIRRQRPVRHAQPTGGSEPAVVIGFTSSILTAPRATRPATARAFADALRRVLRLPPLESLRFFEAAARYQSFAHASEELCVTPAAVAHRVRMLEKHLDVPLFDRSHRSVRLNRRGRAYLKEVQRILAEVHGASERQRCWPRRVRIVSVEAVAQKWLMPRLATFKAAHPSVAIELETNHRGVDPVRRDFDAWLAYTGGTAAPRPVTSREDTLLKDTLYEENLLPVCSPALLAARGRPRGPADLCGWPLLYDLGWDADWSYWFARQGESTPDLSRASGFRLYRMLVQAAVCSIGAAVGWPMPIARELEYRTLVPLFDRQAEAPERYCLITTAASRQRPEVQAFREWVLDEARAAAGAGSRLPPALLA